MTLYEGRLPAFRALLAGCEGEFACFYDAASRLADLDAAQRSERLDALAGSESMSP
jgi:predicted aminopeptidase